MFQYTLMHKNHECGTFALDEKTGKVIKYRDNRNGMSPYLGTSDLRKIQQWWKFRAAPPTRRNIQQAVITSGCQNASVNLAKNSGLSMTDTYWIKPEGVNLFFDDVKLTNGKSQFDPNASLGGQMEKYWDLAQPTSTLVKESYKYFGQQSINEVFATMLHKRQGTGIPFVKYYGAVLENDIFECRCFTFTSENVEFVAAHELLESQKTKNEQSLYDKFISVCDNNGINISDFIDYQTMTDFIISNTDEHFFNFGVLRDTNTMKLIGPAPIFDSGNSMFFDDSRKVPYTRESILKIINSGFYRLAEKILKKVKNRNLVKIDLLPTPSEVKDFYANAGIPEEKADIISKNYEIKLQLFSEFQNGKTISLYNEKRNKNK